MGQTAPCPTYFAAAGGDLKASPTDGGGHTVAGHTLDGTLTTAGLTTTSTVGKESYVSKTSSSQNLLASHEYILEKSRVVAEQSATILDASLHRSKSYSSRTTGGGELSSPVTFGEHNIEAVLREEGVSPVIRERYEQISKFGFVEVTSPQPSVPDRRNVVLSYYPQPGSPPQRRQPKSPEKASLASPPPSKSPQKGAATSPLTQYLKPQDQSSSHQSLPSKQSRPSSNSEKVPATRGVSEDLQLPSLKQSRDSALYNTRLPLESKSAQKRDQHLESVLPTSSTQREESRPRKTNSEGHQSLDLSHGAGKPRDPSRTPQNGPAQPIACEAPKSRLPVPSLTTTTGSRPLQRSASPIIYDRRTLQRPASPGGSLNGFQGPSPPKPSQRETKVPSKNTTASIPPRQIVRLTGKVGGGGLRPSRIPSPPPLNPEGSRLIPRRNISPRRAATPEKRLSPRRFALPPSGRAGSPPQKTTGSQGAANATSKPPTTTRSIRDSVNHPNNPKASQSMQRSNPAPVHIATGLPPMQEQTMETAPVDQSPRHSPGVERLSSYLSDSFSATELSSMPDMNADRVENSRADVSNGGKRNSTGKLHPLQAPTGNRIVDESLDRRMNSWAAGNRRGANEIERFRAAADNEYWQHQDHSSLHQQLDFPPPSGQNGTDSSTSKLGSARPMNRQNMGTHSKTPVEYFNATPRAGAQTVTSGPRYDTDMYQSPLRVSTTPQIDDDRIDSQDAIDDLASTCGDMETMDSQCLRSMQLVMLKSCAGSATVRAHRDQVLAELDGPGLGRNDELLQVIKFSEESTEELRYGDIVLLRSTVALNNVLGVRRRRKEMNALDEVGFFDEGKSKSDRWMIIAAKPDREISIGRAAIMASANDRHQSVRAPVRNLNAILLRNAYNGGILSVKDGSLMLLTDSYESSRAPMSSDPTLLGRLQQHDRFIPSKFESFQLILQSVPPCPSWAISRGVGERLFLTGSYMLEPRRNQRNAEFETHLFDGSTQLSTPSHFSPVRVNPNLSTLDKEKILIDEVIGSFLGLEGLHIRLKGSKGRTSSLDHFEFQLFDADGVTFDLSLRNLVEQILPLSTAYVRVRNFIVAHYPGYEYGRVMQALAEGLDSYAEQFVDFVRKLEEKTRKQTGSNSMTMKSVHFDITPLLHSMKILEHATKAAKDKRGGALINAIWSLEKRTYMGDTVAKDLLGTLLEKCSVPYVEMLSAWLRSGRLLDPYSEFMVKQSTDRDARAEFDGDSWMGLFTISEEHVIRDIIPNDTTKNKILVTGKYWNAVQACSSDLKALQRSNSVPAKLTTFKFQSDFSAISSFIESSYQSASQNLMHLLKDKYRLKDSLQTMKRYFLLDQGDFLVHFLDVAEEELLKPAQDVSVGHIQHYLSMSVQQIEAQRDGDVEPSASYVGPNSRNLVPNSLRCRLSNDSLVSYLESIYGDIADHGPKTPSRQVYGSSNRGNTGFEVFSIDFPRVPFPISLVLSRQSMENYNLLFRHLFLSKHVERRLVGVWSDHQLLKKLDSLRGLLGPSFLLRQRMLHFVQNLINYMTFEVVENNWLEMMSSVDMPEHGSSNQKQQTVDDILKIHDEFLVKTLEACLLTNPSLVRSLTKLLNTCLLFTDQMKRFMETTRIVSISSSDPVDTVNLLSLTNRLFSLVVVSCVHSTMIRST